MNATFNLLKKDFEIILFNKTSIIMLIGGTIYMALAPSLAIFACIFLTAYFCLTPFANDEMNNSSYLNTTIPVKKHNFIIARYLFIIINVLIMYSFCLFINFKNFGGNLDISLAYFSILLCFGTLIASLSVPISIKYGTKFLRIIFVVMTMPVTFILTYILNTESVGQIEQIIQIVQNINVSTFFVFITVSVITLLMLSLVLSIKFYKAKEIF